MIEINIVQFLRLGTWLGSAALKCRLRCVLGGSGNPPSARWVHNTPVISLSAECARHYQRAGEALACVTCTLSSYLEDRFSLFSFGQVHPSLLGMKIILQTSLVFPPLIAENCLLQEWRIMKHYFLWRKQSHTSEFSAWIIVCIPHCCTLSQAYGLWQIGGPSGKMRPGWSLLSWKSQATPLPCKSSSLYLIIF